MNYNNLANKARSKIAMYGNSITITREGEKTYNPATNTYSGDDVVINGVALQGSYDEQNIDGTNIQRGDVKITAIFDDVPLVTDKCTFGGKVLNIVNVKPFAPNGVDVVYYTLQCRG